MLSPSLNLRLRTDAAYARHEGQAERAKLIDEAADALAQLIPKAAAKYIAPISEAELAVRICEAQNGMKRPLGATAIQALDGMEPESRNAYRNAARAAMAYWAECIAAANASH